MRADNLIRKRIINQRHDGLVVNIRKGTSATCDLFSPTMGTDKMAP
jgi:hypothetical protein